MPPLVTPLQFLILFYDLNCGDEDDIGGIAIYRLQYVSYIPSPGEAERI